MSNLRSVLSFFAISLCLGVVGAGLMVPVIGTSAALAESGIEVFEALPAELEVRPLAQPSRLLTRDGKPIATFYWQNRREVPLSDVSEQMRNATVAIEDHRFYDHGPVDVDGIARALVKNLVTGSTSGGSTLTQQYVKNVLIANAQSDGDEAGIERARDRSGASGAARKLREMKLAITVEATYSKDEILQRYLNINSYSGSPNVYGVEAAAQQYWGVSAKELDAAQAATLAGIVKNPARFNPQKNPAEVVERRNIVLGAMHEYGYLSAEEYDRSVKQSLDLKPRATPNGCSSAKDLAYFCEYVQSEIRQNPAFGRTVVDRENLLRRGGLTITTSIDSKLQKAAVSSVRRRLPVGDRSGAAQALVSVDVGSGEIRAMTQNTTYTAAASKKPGRTSVNYSVDQPYGGGTGFQPGSTWKPFVLANWLEAGHHLGDVVDGSAPGYYGFTTQGCDARNYAARGYNPRNAGDSGGAAGGMSVLDATKHSVNKAYADMASQLNMCGIRDTATALGVHLGNGEKLSTEKLGDGTEQVLYPSSILGTVSVSPLTMAAAYTAFANHGTRCEPHGVVRVEDADGKAVDAGTGECVEVVDPAIADSVAYALSTTFDGGTTSGLGIGAPAGAKTGTTNFEVGASWVVGFTRGLSTAVWTGDPEGTRDWRTNAEGRMPRIVFGATVSGPTWQEFMRYAAPTATTGPFPMPAEEGSGGPGSGSAETGADAPDSAPPGPPAPGEKAPAPSASDPAPSEKSPAGLGGN